MEHNEEKNLVFRIIKYCLDKEVVSKRQIYQELVLTQNETIYVERYLVCNTINNVTSNNILGIVNTHTGGHHLDNEYKLLPTAVFQYVDFLEIKDARKNSIESKRLSWIAIAFGLLATFLQIYFQK